MKFSLLPKHDSFFKLFKDSSANLKVSAEKLLDLMENYDNVPEKVAEIKRLEEVGDDIIHQIMMDLHQAFITPLDRDDIAELGERLDDVLDCIEEAARYMMEYDIGAPTESSRELSRIIVRCTGTIDNAMGILGSGSRKFK